MWKILLVGLTFLPANLSINDVYQFLRSSVLISLACHLWGPAHPTKYLHLCMEITIWASIYLGPFTILWSIYGQYVFYMREQIGVYGAFISFLPIYDGGLTSCLWVFCGLSFQTFDTVMDTWLFVSHLSFCPQIFQSCVTAFLYTWNFIWQAHNMSVLKDQQFTFHHFLTSLTGWLRMVLVIAKVHIGYAASDFSILRGLGVQGRPRCAFLFIPVYSSLCLFIFLFFVVQECRAGPVVPFYSSWSILRWAFLFIPVHQLLQIRWVKLNINNIAQGNLVEPRLVAFSDITGACYQRLLF